MEGVTDTEASPPVMADAAQKTAAHGLYVIWPKQINLLADNCLDNGTVGIDAKMCSFKPNCLFRAYFMIVDDSIALSHSRTVLLESRQNVS